MDILVNFWHLFVLSAPWLLLGLFVAGVIHVFIPKDFLTKHLGKEGMWTTVKAALIGAPMPLCSCGVIPAAIGLRRAGASKSATTAFLVSTPETGVDSISVSYALLGPFMAIIRPIAAVSSAIVAGVLVGRDEPSDSKTKPNNMPKTSCCEPQEADKLSCCEVKSKSNCCEPEGKSSCCASDPTPVVTSRVESCCTPDDNKEVNSCCASDVKSANSTCHSADQPFEKADCCAPEQVISSQEVKLGCCASDKAKSFTIPSKLASSLEYSSGKLLNDTMKWLIIGLFFAALIQTYVPPEFLGQWGSGILAMTVVILISIPMYICATASTPIAAGLLLAGVSPGAVLVFMLAGPATNIATIGVVANELGRRAVAAYLGAVIGVAILFGFLTDYLVEHFDIKVIPVDAMQHEVLPQWLSLISAVLLAGLMARLVVRSFR
ncbi:Transporter [Pseudoalteromonas luteoviolacea B = ATCC 29581]|nr:Transporter [Pseudoalteromonas luteoviolacea B = ATCC 29581]